MKPTCLTSVVVEVGQVRGGEPYMLFARIQKAKTKAEGKKSNL